MAIRLSEREQPREQELRKQLQRFEEIYREELPDGNIKQILMTPRGKITRIFDPITNKIINQRTQSFRIASDENQDVTPAPVEKPSIPDLSNMKLNEIARIIRGDWKNVYFGAVPYLDAMRQLRNMTDKYGYDPATSIVAYFLGNATNWRGDVARAVKKELNRRLNKVYRRR